jgi:hypothetical protein
MCRHGRVELLLVLPDGTKSLIPAAWTDQSQDAGGAAEAATVGSLADLLAMHELICGLARTAAMVDGRQAARQSSCEEDNRAACAVESDAGAGAGATAEPDRRTSAGARSRGGCGAGRVDRQGRRDRAGVGGGR